MANARSDAGPTRLVEYFLISELHEADQPSSVVFRFPPENHEDVALPDQAVAFCAQPVPEPSSHKLEFSAQAAPQFYAFVLQAEDGRRLFGGTVQHSLKDGAKQFLTLVGSQAHLEAFRRILRYILFHLTCPDPAALPLESLLTHLIYEVPAPQPHFQVSLSCPFPLTLAVPPGIPTAIDSPVAALFDVLGVDLVMKLFACALLEQRILIASSQLSLITIACMATLSFLHPLRWPYVFIPLLPGAHVDLMHCPTPYIVGIQSSALVHVFKDSDLPEYVLFNLDQASCTLPHRLPALPYQPEQVLRRDLISILQPGLLRLDQVLAEADTVDTGRETAFSLGTTRRIQASFAKFVDEIIADHRKFVIKLGYDNDSQVLFNKFGFVRRKDARDAEFYDHFVQTQCFQELLDNSVSLMHKIANVISDVESVDISPPSPELRTSHSGALLGDALSTSPAFATIPTLRPEFVYAPRSPQTPTAPATPRPDPEESIQRERFTRTTPLPDREEERRRNLKRHDSLYLMPEPALFSHEPNAAPGIEAKIRQTVLKIFEGRKENPKPDDITAVIAMCTTVTGRRLLAATLAALHSADAARELESTKFDAAVSLMRGCLAHATESADFKFTYQTQMFCRTFYKQPSGEGARAVFISHEVANAPIWSNPRYWIFAFWKALRLRRLIEDTSLEDVKDMGSSYLVPRATVRNLVGKVMSQKLSSWPKPRNPLPDVLFEVLVTTVNDMREFGLPRAHADAVLGLINQDHLFAAPQIALLDSVWKPPGERRKTDQFITSTSIAVMKSMQEADTVRTHIADAKNNLTDESDSAESEEMIVPQLMRREGTVQEPPSPLGATRSESQVTRPGIHEATPRLNRRFTPNFGSTFSFGQIPVNPSTTTTAMPATARASSGQGPVLGALGTQLLSRGASFNTVSEDREEAKVYHSLMGAFNSWTIEQENEKDKLKFDVKMPLFHPQEAAEGLGALEFSPRVLPVPGGVSAITADSWMLVCGAKDGSLSLYSLPSLDVSAQRPTGKPNHKSAIKTLALGWSRLVTGGEDGLVKVWDLAGLRPMLSLRANETHKSPVRTARFVEEHVVVSGYADGTLSFWDCRSPTALHEVLGGAAIAGGVTCSDHGHEFHFLTGGADKALRLWDMRNRSVPVSTLRGHRGQVSHCRLHRHHYKDLRAVSADDRGLMHVWNLEGAPQEHDFIFKLETYNESPICSLDILQSEWLEMPGKPSPSPLMLTGDALGAVRVHDLGHGGTLSILRKHTTPVTSCGVLQGSPWTDPTSWHSESPVIASQGRRFYQNGQMLCATGDREGTVRLSALSRHGAVPITHLSGHGAQISQLLVTEPWVIAAGGSRVVLWKAEEY